MAPWLRVLASVGEDLDSVASTHVAAHNCLQLQFRGIRLYL